MNKRIIFILLFCTVTAYAMTVEEARTVLGLSQDEQLDSTKINQAYIKKLGQPDNEARERIFEANDVLMQEFVASAPPLSSSDVSQPVFVVENTPSAQYNTGTSYFFELRNRSRDVLNIQIIIDDGSNRNLLVFPKAYASYPLEIKKQIIEEPRTQTAGYNRYYQLKKRPLSSFIPYAGEDYVPVVRLRVDAQSKGQLEGKRLVLRIFGASRQELGRYHITLGKYRTIYVSWENGTLRVQQGRNGRTISGLSLTDNIRQQELVKQRAKPNN